MVFKKKTTEEVNSKPKTTKSTTAKKTAVPKEKPKSVMYVTKRRAMAHPFQGVRFYPRTPVECRKDDWLAAQIKAGFIKEVK